MLHKNRKLNKDKYTHNNNTILTLNQSYITKDLENSKRFK